MGGTHVGAQVNSGRGVGGCGLEYVYVSLLAKLIQN